MELDPGNDTFGIKSPINAYFSSIVPSFSPLSCKNLVVCQHRSREYSKNCYAEIMVVNQETQIISVLSIVQYRYRFSSIGSVSGLDQFKQLEAVAIGKNKHCKGEPCIKDLFENNRPV